MCPVSFRRRLSALLPCLLPLSAVCLELQGPEADSVCVSVLLHGPSGCGKSTAVSAAAAALGLNVVPYSCHEFIGQSDAAVAMAIRAALESAQEFAPALLHLEDFSALCSAEQAQGSAPGAVIISAAVCKDCNVQ